MDLRQIRRLRGLTLDAVAKAAGVSTSRLSRAERGFARLQSEEQKRIEKILQAEGTIGWKDHEFQR